VGRGAYLRRESQERRVPVSSLTRGELRVMSSKILGCDSESDDSSVSCTGVES